MYIFHLSSVSLLLLSSQLDMSIQGKFKDLLLGFGLLKKANTGIQN